MLFQYVLLKLLGPSGKEAERVGVHSVKLFGHKSSSEQLGSNAFLHQLVRLHTHTHVMWPHFLPAGVD